MLLSVERQREIHVLYPDRNKVAAMFARQQNFEFGKTQAKGKWTKKDKCSHCHLEGHNVEQCFKLNGYPDWYKVKKDFRQQKGSTSGSTSAVNYLDTPQLQSMEGLMTQQPLCRN